MGARPPVKGFWPWYWPISDSLEREGFDPRIVPDPRWMIRHSARRLPLCRRVFKKESTELQAWLQAIANRYLYSPWVKCRACSRVWLWTNAYIGVWRCAECGCYYCWEHGHADRLARTGCGACADVRTRIMMTLHYEPDPAPRRLAPRPPLCLGRMNPYGGEGPP